MPQETKIFRGEEEIEVSYIKRKIYEIAGERDREGVVKLVEEVGKILDEEKRRGSGQLKRTIPEILGSRVGGEYFVDESVVYLPKEGEAIIIGDIHGDPESIVSVLEQNNFIEEMEKGNRKLKLVFLGDYIDRGRKSRAAIELILDLKRRYPNNIILLRGNHEEKGVYPHIGIHTFGKELYGSFDKKNEDFTESIEKRITAGEIFKSFYDFFTKLPSVLVTGNGLIATHGGIPSRKIYSLRELRKNEDILADMRFTDPSEDISGIGDNAERKGGKIFGRDAFSDFMIKGGATVMIRSHGKVEGDRVSKKLADIFFGGRLAGIFSTGGSKGVASSGYVTPLITPAFARISLEVPKTRWEKKDFHEITYQRPNLD